MRKREEFGDGVESGVYDPQAGFGGWCMGLKEVRIDEISCWERETQEARKGFGFCTTIQNWPAEKRKAEATLLCGAVLRRTT